MTLEELVKHCQFKIGSQYRVYEDEGYLSRSGGQVFIIEDRSDREIIAEFEGTIQKFSIKLSKDLSKDLRKTIMGWYVGLYQHKDSVFRLAIVGKADHRQYISGDRGVMLAEYTKGLPYYFLYRPTSEHAKLLGVEIIKQITYELINEGYAQ